MKFSKLILFTVTWLIFYRLSKSEAKAKVQEKTLTAEPDRLSKAYHNLIREYAEVKQVRYISIAKKIYYAKDAAGQPIIWTHTLADSMAALPADQYFQLGRGCIVHRSIIAALKPAPLERKLYVFLAAPFNTRFELPTNKIEVFKLWWSQEGAY